MPLEIGEPLFFFDPKQMENLSRQFASDYVSAQPFPHSVIDGLLPEWVIDRLLEEFPSSVGEGWTRYRGVNEVKLALNNEAFLGPFTRHVLSQFNSAEFVRFLEKLTGIPGLVPDPYFEGGGLHQTERGGLLSIHADFNKHPHLMLDRRLNVLVYLNRDWKEEYGGALELWDSSMSHMVRNVIPVSNRCVIFNTTAHSYHGHPDPLQCPSDRTRKSIAFYYYSNGRDDGRYSPSHSTLFQARQGNRAERFRRFKDTAQRWIPPALLDLYSSGKWLRSGN